MLLARMPAPLKPVRRAFSTLTCDEKRTILPIDEANVPIPKRVQCVCHHTLDFVSAPGYPSAIRVFALTHSSRIVFQR